MADKLGQPMVIDNKSGAGGTVGTAVAARAPADGSTLLLGDTGLTYAPLIYPNAGFDFLRDFAPISAVARVPYVLAVNPAKLDVSTLAEFIAAAKKQPGAIDVGSAGVGTVTHLAINLFDQARRGEPQPRALSRRRADAAGPAGRPGERGLRRAERLVPHVQSGKLRALAIAGRRREPSLPNVPTMAEAGLPDFRATIWFGLFAPSKTPDAVLDRIHGAVQAALQTEKVRQLWADQGVRVELESRADFARFVAEDTERWSRIARAANIKLE